MRFGANRTRMANARMLSRVNNRPEPGQVLRPFPPDDVMVARNRAPKVVTQQVSIAPGTGGVKAKQAWKYPGGNIVRADSTLINGRYYTDPKEPNSYPDDQGTESGRTDGTPRRKQESNFFLTINPNQMYTEVYEAGARVRFMMALEHLNSNETFARILKFGPKDAHYMNDKACDVLLPGIEWDAAVEIGEEKKRMHAHVCCYIKHYSQIQFCPKMLAYEFRAAFNEGLPASHRLFIKDLPYVHIKLEKQGAWRDIMRQYMQKGMQVGLA